MKIRPFISNKKVLSRIRTLAKNISDDHKGKQVAAVCVLKGAVVFFCELMKRVKVPYSIDLVGLSSYGSKKISSRRPKLTGKLNAKVKGKHVLIVEDIIDTGHSIDFLKKAFKKKGALSVKVAALLDKPSRRKLSVKGDYVGFRIPDKFVVGFGMDLAEKFRHLPFIGEVK